MSDAQLLEFINQQLRNGAPKDQIKNSLVAGGWKATDVDQAFIEIAASDSSVPLPPGAARPMPGIGSILNESFGIYKQQIGTFVGIMAIPALLSAAAVISISLFKQLSTGSLLAASGIVIILLILAFFVQVWATIALVYAIKDRDEKIGIAAAYGRARKMILPYIWVSILTGLIVMGGMLLFIVPGIIFSIWFSMAAFVLINENVRGMNALFKSKDYARGKWIDLFIRYLALVLVCIGILLVERILFAFLPDTFSSIAQNIANSLLIAPVTTAYLFLTYHHLKASKGQAAVAAARPKMTGLIIVAVIGLLIIPVMLSTLAITSLGSARTKIRDVKRTADIKQISTAIEMYYADNDKLPASLNDLNSYGKLVDPTTKQPYKYAIDPNGTDYKVCADMELSHSEQCVGSTSTDYDSASPKLTARQSRDAKRVADQKLIMIAIDKYYDDHGKLPADLSDLTLYGTLVDPSTKQPYKYVIDPNGTDYKVCVTIELTGEEHCGGTYVPDMGHAAASVPESTATQPITPEPMASDTQTRDAQRLNDTKAVFRSVFMYFTSHANIPASLSDLSPQEQLVDPSTGKPYTYRIAPNGYDYSVCAMMETTQTEMCTTKDNIYKN